MAFTLGKKGTEWNPRDPRNRHIAHPNPGGGDNPPSDPATTAAAGVHKIDRGVLSAAAPSVLDLRSPTNADADTGEEDDNAVASSYWATARNPLLAMETIAREQNGEDNDGGELLDALAASNTSPEEEYELEGSLVHSSAA
jgi:hypothetical protein